MKKRIITTILILCLAVTGCGTGAEQQHKEQGTAGAVKQTDTGASQSGSGSSPGGIETSETKGADGLRLLCDRQMNFVTQEGYYYITENQSELSKDLWGRHIMYMDFATKKEVYLCNEPGCKHKDKNCTSVLSGDEVTGDILVFVMEGRLYLICKGNDTEDSMEMAMTGDGEEDAQDKKPPTVIWSMGLDGSDRKKEYTFDQDITVDNIVLCDRENIYLAAKSIRNSSEKNKVWHTSSQRELVRFRPEDSRLETVCSLQPDEKIRWYVVGASGGKVIMRGTKYNGDLSFKEQMELERKESWNYQNDSSEVYAIMDLADGSMRTVYSIKNDPDSENCSVILGDFLYVSLEKQGVIRKVDLKTGKAEKLVKLKHNFIAGTISDTLCCRAWDQTKPQYYFVNVRTGKVSHSTLVNKCNGWDLDIRGEAGDQVLVIYDYEAEEEEKGEWEISRYQYGLIRKKDLFNSVDKFQKIDMKEAGE